MARARRSARIPHPYAIDSTDDQLTGGGHYTDKASVALGKDTDGTPTITVSVDPEWLASAIYPVYVDPTVTLFQSTNNTADAHTASSYPTQNLGAYQMPTSPFYYEMWLGTDPSGTSGVSRDYVRWDLSLIGVVTVEAAQVSTHPWHQYYNAPTTIRSWIARLTSGFTKSTINHNNKPSAGNDLAFIDGVEGQTTWSNPASGFTSVVQGWVTTPATNYGVRIWEDGLEFDALEKNLRKRARTRLRRAPNLKGHLASPDGLDDDPGLLRVGFVGDERLRWGDADEVPRRRGDVASKSRRHKRRNIG